MPDVVSAHARFFALVRTVGAFAFRPLAEGMGVSVYRDRLGFFVIASSATVFFATLRRAGGVERNFPVPVSVRAFFDRLFCSAQFCAAPNAVCYLVVRTFLHTGSIY